MITQPTPRMRPLIRFLLCQVMLLAAPVALLAQDGTPSVSIENLAAVNSAADDYGPYITANGEWMYFTSSRKGDPDLFRSRRQPSGWGMPSLADQGGPQGLFSGPVPALAALYGLGSELLSHVQPPGLGVITRPHRSGRRISTDLFEVRIAPDGSSLQLGGPIDALNSDDWESQPAVAPDGSFIIFSSTRPGGLGGKDLYIARRNAAGGFSTPENLGRRVNSSGDDIAPFIAPDGVTLFFASSGHGGFGGTDIYVAELKPSGADAPPRNLGPAINTAAHELFFFAVDRERFYFVSDRSGGAGGLDIYTGGPNIFAPGYTQLEVAVRDTVRGVDVRGSFTVVETTSGREVAAAELPGSSAASVPILHGYGYRLTVRAQGFGDTSLIIDPPGPTQTVRRVINVGSPLPPPPPPPERPVFALDFEAVDIPLFVSGYYRLNTVELLEDLRKKQAPGGALHGREYIADVYGDQQLFEEYRRMAQGVAKTLDRFYQRSITELFPSYLQAKEPGEYLEITVYGYADPRPINGTYAESPVTFVDARGREVRLEGGDALDNFKLAGLRARYAVEYFDRLFRTSAGGGAAAYQQLAEQGAIRWRAVSGNIADTGGPHAEQRRIRIEFKRVVP